MRHLHADADCRRVLRSSYMRTDGDGTLRLISGKIADLVSSALKGPNRDRGREERRVDD